MIDEVEWRVIDKEMKKLKRGTEREREGRGGGGRGGGGVSQKRT